MTEECGAQTSNGGTCSFKEKYPDGRCGHHTDHTDTSTGKQSTLEQHPEIVDLMAQEIQQEATISEALAEVEEKTGLVIPRSTHDNWIAKGKQAGEDGLYKEYRSQVTRARKLAVRSDRGDIKNRAKEQGDIRTLYKFHMEQYGDLYEGDTSVEQGSGAPFAVPEELLNEWQQQTS